MTIVQCPKCFAGNASSDAACHHCGARVKAGPQGTLLAGQVTILDEHVHDGHILDTAMAVQRSREATVARRMLTAAAVLYFLRVVAVPVLQVFVTPEKFAPFAGPQVSPIHWVCLVVFTVCALWARREPLTATLTAGVLFLVAAAPGFYENRTIAGGALVGKLLMLIIVWRAVSAAIVYRANCSRPELPKPAKAKPAPPQRLAA